MSAPLSQQVRGTLDTIERMQPVTRGAVAAARRMPVSHHFEQLLACRLIRLHHIGDEPGRPKYFATAPHPRSVD